MSTPRSRNRLSLVLPLAVAVVVAAAGCGSGSPETYDAADTRACLREAGLRVTPPPPTDFVASSATAGAFRAHFRGEDANAVTISFGETPEDAEQTSQGYVRTRDPHVGVFDVLGVERNAVLLWQEHPRDEDLETVTGCLR